MNVISKRGLTQLIESAKLDKDTRKELDAWYRVARAASWRHLADVQGEFPATDQVGRVLVFDIRHNRYRLVTIIHYAREKEGRVTMGHIYIRSFLAHREYDNRTNWDKGVKR